jgi:hypothetical protein
LQLLSPMSHHQFGSLIGSPQTTEAARYDDDAIGEFLADMESSFGLLDPGDLSHVRGILSKYVGRSAGTNELGATTQSTDAADAGRQAAAVVRANIENNQSVATGCRDFWDTKNAELAASIRR